jgi:hypothetical protein
LQLVGRACGPKPRLTPARPLVGSSARRKRAEYRGRSVIEWSILKHLSTALTGVVVRALADGQG